MSKTPNSESTIDDTQAADFLAGGGEMGARMRALDWSASALGNPEGWPQSLKTAVSLMLNSRYPMFLAWGPELAFLYNDGYRPIFGNKHPGALGRPFAEIWSEIWDSIEPLVLRALDGQATFSEDLMLVMERSGYLEETYFTFSYSPVRDESGGVGGMFCACTETTGSVLGERRLGILRDLGATPSSAGTPQEAAAHCLKVLDAARADIPFVMLYSLEPDGGAQFIGKAGDVPDGAAPDPGFWRLEQTIAGESAMAHELDVRSSEATPGGFSPRSPWGDPVQDAFVLPLWNRGQGAPSSALVLGVSPRRAFDEEYRSFLDLVGSSIATAMADAHALEAERQRAEKLAEIDHAKTLFFSNVSHEFRTPLTLMLGPLEESLAEAALLPPAEAERVRMVHRNGMRLLKLVNSLLDFSRIEAGRTVAQFEPTDLAILTAELASNFRSATEKAGLVLVVDCPPLSEPVHVDRDMWEKIVLNLLSNAFKFTFEGAITVELKPVDGAARLRVRDTGTGIAAHELPHVFERFHRIEGARGRSYEGSGIGLALVQELVKLHGGTIGVESEEGRGTVFTVSIPLGTAHLPPHRVLGEQSLASKLGRASAYVEEALRWLPETQAAGETAAERDFAASALGVATPDAGEQASILLADDNADMRDYVRRLLGDNYSVETVADGQAALEALRERRRDLVLTDIMMPRLDGFGLLSAIREDPDLRDIPVIVLSARAGEEAQIEGAEAGADGYLVKPFQARELIARVDGVLALARLRRQSNEALHESEARFRTMADNAPVVVWTTDANGACTYLSRSWYELTGQTPETALGFGWLDATHPDDRESSAAVFLEANEHRRAFSLEYRLRRHDGTYRWMIDAAAPWLGEDGGFRGYIGSVVDITEHKDAEEALRASESQIRELLDCTAEGFYAVDREGRTTHCNPAFLKMLGFESDQDAIGKRLHDVIHHSHADGSPYSGAECPIYICASTGAPAHVADESFYRLDGTPIPVEYWAYPIVRDGELHGAICTFLDVTERKVAEAALRELNETLEDRVAQAIADREVAEAQLRQAQKMEALGKLTGGVAHDFNNLLQVISGNLQMLGKDIGGNAKAEERLHNALAGVSRGAKLASQLLAFGRRQALVPKVLNVGRLVLGIEDMLRRVLGEEIELDMVVAPHLWNTLADPSQVENALLNLAINARDAMDGHGRLTIAVENALRGGPYGDPDDSGSGEYVTLAVSDTGCGIPAEIMEQVFEPFFTTKSEGQGTGLGLSMVYGFVKQSSGHVEIDSEPGRGTTVRIHLPRVQMDEQEDDVATPDADALAGGTETILVVEDDDDVRKTVVAMLTDLRFRVREAPDAASALELVESGAEIDLLFTDVVMPGPMRSPELAAKARERLPHLAVLFTSGYAEDSIVHHGRLDEGIELLSKPYTQEALAQRIRDLLNRRPGKDRPVATPGEARTEGPLRILLVEDDGLIRLNTADMLAGLGHSVLEAGNAPDAVALIEKHRVDVLMTDVGLPGASGPELAVEASRRVPGLRIVFATGNDTVPEMESREELAKAVVLRKPYDDVELAQALRETE